MRTDFAPPDFGVPGVDTETVGFHVYLLGPADLMKTHDVTVRGNRSPQAIPISITWQGYDFLAAAKSDAIWKKAGLKLAQIGGSASFEVLKALLVNLAKEQLKLP